ncbi:hypothetical protein KAW80_03340 [Candidatus Babeliales bacterium]|nr:hypothetical protein [Candidatus Babeliales bacterium]
MYNTGLSLLPLLITLAMAFITKRVVFSLFCGITSAAFIAADFSPTNTATLIIKRIWETTELNTLVSWKMFMSNWNLFICLFLIILAIIITLISHSGGAYAYGNFISKKINTKKGAETSSLLLSFLFFVDDYFNSLTVGAVMHPITDQYKVPRAKLAFLVDSMAAPLCILSPVSSWIALIIMQLKKSGVSDIVNKDTYVLAEPFYVYIRTLPFVLYSFIIIATSWFIVRRKISFGLMAKHEDIAKKTGNLFGGKDAPHFKIKSVCPTNKNRCSIGDFIFPISTLSISIILGILYSGGYYLLGGNNNLTNSFQNAEVPIALFLGGLITWISTSIFLYFRKKLNLESFLKTSLDGTKLMMPAIIILILAWTLGTLLKDDLLTGQYLAKVLVGNIDIRLFPVMFFIASACSSFATGSSWGTVAIFFPIAIPMLMAFLRTSVPANINEISFLFPVLGAILSGAVSGDHISPISDTTIMAACSTGCSEVDHVQTQFSYAFPVLIATSIAFLVSGFIPWWNIFTNIFVSLLIGIGLCFILLEIMNRIRKK